MKYLLVLILLSCSLAEVLRVPFFLSSGISVVDMLVPIVVCLWLIWLIVLRRGIKLYNGFIPLMLFFVIGGVSLVINSGQMQLEMGEFVNSLFYYLRFAFMTALILIAYNLKEKDSKFVLNGVFWSSLLIFIFGVYQLVYFPDFEKLGMDSYGWDPHKGRMLSSWFDPNYLGGYFSFVSTLGIGVAYNKFREKERGIGKYFLLLFIALLVAGIVFTYSRSSLLALIVSFGVMGLFLSIRLLFVGVVVFVLATTFSSRMQERIMSGVDSAKALFVQSEKSLDPTAKLRLKSWEVGMDIYKENPVMGVGFNTLKYVQKKKWALQTNSHGSSGIDSSLITVAATTGTLGLIAFLVFIFQILRTSFAGFFKYQDGYQLAVFAGLLGILAHSVFVNTLFFYAFMPTFFIAVGLLNMGRR